MTQRLRITYRKHGPAVAIEQGEMQRAWGRAFEAAGIVLGRQGRRPALAFAAPLPAGAFGDRELLDAWLEEPVVPADACERLNGALPPGLAAVDVEEIGERLPALQACARSARYLVRLPSGAVDRAALEGRVAALLAARCLEWEEQRGERVKQFDLRATVLDLTVRDDAGTALVDMQLSLEPARTGRPSSVLAALGVECAPLEVRRTEVVVERPRVALAAWRAVGRFE